MERRDRLDGFGVLTLLGSTFLFAINVVVVKLVNAGLQPVFFAGLRSAGAVFCVLAWMYWRGRPPRIAAGTAGAGLLVGIVFALEFLCFFVSLDHTTVVRASIIFYSMPVWLALAAHFWLPEERLTPVKALGLGLAFAGVAWAIGHRGGSGEASLAGDLWALAAAIGWAGTAFLARASALRRVSAEMQLLWMVAVSGVVLLALAPLFGPLLRDLHWQHLAGLAFQIVFIATGGFILWLWLLSVYPASSVASFSFLTPILGILLGWALLGEPVPAQTLAAGGLVAAGIVLINRPRKRRG